MYSVCVLATTREVLVLCYALEVSVISPESGTVLVTIGRGVCDVDQTRYICHIHDMTMVIDVELCHVS